MAARAVGAERGTRRWPRRLLVGLTAFVALCVLAAGAGLLYVRYRLGQIDRLDLGGLADDAGGPMNVLLVGSDSRARLTGEAAAQAGKGLVEGERSDTIMVLHVNPREKKAAILSIPRDLHVPIPGAGRSDRINVAYSLGGPQRLVSTVRNALGIDVHHYVEVDFVGFKSLVDTLGGVRIYVPAPARDQFSGLSIRQPGCVRLDGDQALGWVRSRHFQYYSAGRWREDPSGDLGRIQRQQDFIRRTMKTAVSTGLTNPLRLNRIIGIGVKDVTMDSAMSTKDVVRLANRFRSLDPDTVDMLTLPTRPANVGGHSVLKVQPEARAYIDRMNGKAPVGAGGGPSAVQPGDIRVRVLNGTGADEAASRVGQALEERGFNVADKGDADSFRYGRTLVRHAPGQSAKAHLLQRHLQSGAQVQEDRSLRTVDVALVIGGDYAGLRAQPAEAGAPPGPSAPSAPAPSGPVPAPRGAPAQPPC